jgi:hypothetical protein
VAHCCTRGGLRAGGGTLLHTRTLVRATDCGTLWLAGSADHVYVSRTLLLVCRWKGGCPEGEALLHHH